MIKLTPADRETFADAERLGIGDGYTVPAHAPGELNGSCSFAVATGRSFPQQHHLIAQLVGGLAFEAARLLVMPPELRSAELPVLTGRQRECVVLAAQGHTDPQIAKILDIRPDTAVQHMKQARDRWGLHNRMSLGVRALFFQVISFAEVFGGNPHFWE